MKIIFSISSFIVYGPPNTMFIPQFQPPNLTSRISAPPQLPPMGHDRHIPPGTFSHPRILAAGATIIDLFGLLFPLGTEIIS